jgi:PPM family protein phosphatase
MQIHVGAGTDLGRVRSGNEDNFFAEADERRGVFVVADGMGGHAAGEVASEMAVQIVARHLLPLSSVRDAGAADLVNKSLQDANKAIYDRMRAETDKQGMGTTASVMVLSDHGYLIGHIGDSRVYLFRDGHLVQITKDHSYVQEQVDAGLLTPDQARYHPYSNVITRCVGAVFLLCSDGLTGMVDDRRLAQLLMARTAPGRVVDALVAEANGRGGLDNITAIVVHVMGLEATDD